MVTISPYQQQHHHHPRPRGMGGSGTGIQENQATTFSDRMVMSNLGQALFAFASSNEGRFPSPTLIAKAPNEKELDTTANFWSSLVAQNLTQPGQLLSHNKPSMDSMACDANGVWKGNIVYADGHTDFHESPTAAGGGRDNIFQVESWEGSDAIITFTKEIWEDGFTPQWD